VFADAEDSLDLARHLETTHGLPWEAAHDRATAIEGAAIEAAAQEVAGVSRTTQDGQMPGPEKAESAAPVGPRGRATPARPRKERSMAYPCALCRKVGHPQAQCPEKPPGAKPCSDCRRVVGHAPKCKIKKPGGKGTASNGRAPHRGGRAPKPATPTAAATENGGLLTLKGFQAQLEERAAKLRAELTRVEAALAEVAGAVG
jgi:hypothetical protein